MLAHHYVTALELRRAAGGDAAVLETPARLALREAGNRAYALSALEASATFQSARALKLWPKDDPDYPRLLLERGRALSWLRAEGIPELLEAADLFRAAGQDEAAAEAEANLGDVYRFCGHQQTSLAHHERAIALIADLPETRVTAWIRALAWRAALLAGQRVSLEESTRILALAEELGTAEEVLMARITFGLAQGAHGDPYAEIDTLERALELARQANSHLVGRASANLATILSIVGDLVGAGHPSRGGRAGAPSRKPPRVPSSPSVRSTTSSPVTGMRPSTGRPRISSTVGREGSWTRSRTRCSRRSPRRGAMELTVEAQASCHDRLRP